MEAKELMIGDWVLYNGNIFIEDEYEPSVPILSIQIESGEDIDLAINGCYSPIPLTAEILERNGFVKHEKIHPYYMDYYHERDGFTIFNSRTWHGHILNSVHELQHALRLCGLNDLADSFKV